MGNVFLDTTPKSQETKTNKSRLKKHILHVTNMFLNSKGENQQRGRDRVMGGNLSKPISDIGLISKHKRNSIVKKNLF